MSEANHPDPKLLDLFKQEAETHIQNISQSLLQWEETPSNSALIEQLMRAAHSLKGAARIIGLTDFSKIAHLLEDCFVAAQKETLTLKPEDFDTILECINFLSQVKNLTNEELINWPGNKKDQLKLIEDSIIAINKGDSVSSKKEINQSEITSTESAIFILFKNEVLAQTLIIKNQLEDLKNKSLNQQNIIPLITAALSIRGTSQIAKQINAENIATTLEQNFKHLSDKNIKLDSTVTEQILSLVDRLVDLTKIQSEKKPTPSLTDSSSTLKVFDENIIKNSNITQNPIEEHETDQFVRVSATNLNRLMGLTAESLVETRRLEPLKQGFLQLKSIQRQLSNLFNFTQKDSDSLKILAITQEARRNLNQYRSTLQNQLEIFDTFSKNNSILSNKLYNEVLASRMRPFWEGVQGFPLLVRNLARSLDKKISLEILGKDTRVDRDILEKLEAPLNHIIRNACDHGIESPKERLAQGKNEKGTIKINARHHSGMLILTVSDDGRGIDKEKILEKILEKNLLPKELVSTLSEDEIFDFLFLPGFSTAKDVTDISGRGVGLDVVRKITQEISGKITVESTKGIGTIFSLQLPITRSVLRTLSVEINNEPYAIPLSQIDQILRIQRNDIHTLENRDYFHLNGRNVAIFSAAQVLGLTRSSVKYNDIVSVVILRVKDNIYSLVVNKILSEIELVIRPLDAKLGKIPCVASTSITDEGIPVIILDVEDILKYIEKILIGHISIESFTHKEQKQQRVKKILIVDDSLTVRETERRLLENAGYQVDIALDGADGWNVVRENKFDLIISDIDMPRINGFELVKLIKSDPNLKKIPIIIISYKDREEDKIHGMEVGANYYLTKSSFKDQTFINAVKDLIGDPIS